MKRTQLQLDEATYQVLRVRAFEQGISLATLVREAVHAYLQAKDGDLHSGDFRFVGSGRSRQGRLKPVSERHDEALAGA